MVGPELRWPDFRERLDMGPVSDPELRWLKGEQARVAEVSTATKWLAALVGMVEAATEMYVDAGVMPMATLVVARPAAAVAHTPRPWRCWWGPGQRRQSRTCRWWHRRRTGQRPRRRRGERHQGAAARLLAGR